MSKSSLRSSWFLRTIALPHVAKGLLLLPLLSSGCSLVITPPGEREEREESRRAEGVFDKALDKRPLPDLSTSATLPDVLEYAFNSNGELEASYREWRAAIERIPQAGALSDPRLEFSTLFSPENVKGPFKAFVEGATIRASQELPGPGKRRARAEAALAEARAAGERFRAAKFQLQKQVIQAYADVARSDALLAQTSETLRLLRTIEQVALHRYHGMEEGTLADLRKIDIEIQTIATEQRSLRIKNAALRATLSGLLNRPPDAPLGPISLPAIRPPDETDAALFARAVENNPELAVLRHEVQARGAGVVLAELERRPDYTIEGGIQNPLRAMLMVGGGLTLPVNRERIRAGIAEAVAMRQAAEARLRNATADIQARVVLAIASIRDADRILDDYHNRVVPLTRELADTQLTTFGSGGGNLIDILDTERLLVDFRTLEIGAQSDRLIGLAELEQVVGEDLFQFLPSPTATPTSPNHSDGSSR